MTRAEAGAVDATHMQRCLELASTYRGRTSPNPIVGCVIVDKRGAVIAEGVHRGPGTRHAEADALHALGGHAKGATLYCNLEPCMHQGRTPPCVPAIKAAGIARVVIGSDDPIDGHGGGVESLRRSGISVSHALRAECDAANRPFLTWALYRRPAFTLKAGMTLDGKIATWAGRSKWITGEAARADGHRLRGEHDAILVGVSTVLVDDPWLTARLRGQRDPIRVVMDSKLRTPPTARLLPGASAAKQKKSARVIIATTTGASVAKEKALVAMGAEVWRLRPHANGRVRIEELARRLGDAEILSVLVEGGGEVHASMMAARYADEIVVYVAPRVVGGTAAPSWVGGKGVKVLEAAYELEFEEVTRLGRDLRLRCAVRPPPQVKMTDAEALAAMLADDV